MTPAARIAATIELLGQINEAARPADSVIASFFRSRRFIGSKDRVDIGERIYRLLRHQARLGWWLDLVGCRDEPRARVIAELALGEGLTAADFAARFDGSRYAPGTLTEQELAFIERLHAPPLDHPVTEEERSLSTSQDDQAIDHPHMPVRILYECPEWAGDDFGAFGPDDFAWELRALLQPAPFDLRVNEFKSDREAVAHRLREDGIALDPTPLSPIGLRVKSRRPLAGHVLYRDGVIEVQDEGSQLVALLVDARPGQQVVDFCAGAGGKALALAARMQGKGRVVACDVQEGRLARAKSRLHRSGLDNVETRVLGSENDGWVRRHKGKFDRVLIDAPCSGSGTWRRHPDARWRPTDLAGLVALQRSILDSASRLVAPGGRLLYSTCSLLISENQDQAEAFQARHPEFESTSVSRIWADVLGTECPAWGAPRPTLQLTPARHGTDGFFVAAFTRRGDGAGD